MTTANESKLGGARGGHRGPIVLRVAAARVLPLLPVAARGARLVLSMGLAAGCVRARSSSSPLRGGHCPPLCVCVYAFESLFNTSHDMHMHMHMQVSHICAESVQVSTLGCPALVAGLRC